MSNASLAMHTDRARWIVLCARGEKRQRLCLVVSQEAAAARACMVWLYLTQPTDWQGQLQQQQRSTEAVINQLHMCMPYCCMHVYQNSVYLMHRREGTTEAWRLMSRMTSSDESPRCTYQCTCLRLKNR